MTNPLSKTSKTPASTKKPTGVRPTYKEAGVDIDAGAALVGAIGPMVKKTHRTGVMGGLGGFGGLFDLKATGYQDPVLVAANDGVGTKLKIAIDTGIHTTVGIDLVAMCVNDLIVQGAEPLFFLDYIATGKIEQEMLVEVVGGIAKGCELAGAALIGGETAEMPGMYARSDYDLAGFAVGAVERNHILPSADIREGDVLIGLPSNGLHSNGFSLVRSIVKENNLGWRDKPPFGNTRTLGEAFLQPTRIYVKPLLDLFRQSQAIRALAHITGGGLTENLPRVLPEGLAASIDLRTIPVQPVFDWLANEQHIEESEMLRTFNAGVGMVLVTQAQEVDGVLETLTQYDEPAFILGKIIETSKDEAVIYHGNLPVYA